MQDSATCWTATCSTPRLDLTPMPKLPFLASTALLFGLALSSCSEPRTGVWTDEGQLFTENGPYFIQGVCCSSGSGRRAAAEL